MSQLELVCPECGTKTTTVAGSRAATDFCSVCDYPLFWATGKATQTLILDDADTTRRSPGVGGAQTIVPIACPTCKELNDPAAVTCQRCGGLMQLPLVVRPPEPPAPQPVVVKQVVTCNHWPIWAIVLISAVPAMILTAAAVKLWWT